MLNLVMVTTASNSLEKNQVLRTLIILNPILVTTGTKLLEEELTELAPNSLLESMTNHVHDQSYAGVGPKLGRWMRRT